METEYKFCGHCGAKLHIDDGFCGECGNPFADSPDIAPVAEEPQIVEPPPPHPPPPPAPAPPPVQTSTLVKTTPIQPAIHKGNPLKTFFNVVLIIVIIGAGIWGFMYIQDQYLVSADNMYFRGENYWYGTYSPKDIDEAMYWYKRAADKGHAQAQYELGFIYQSGLEDVTQDYTEAAKWYTKAANQDHGDSIDMLAAFYYNGWGVEKDINDALDWWEKGAELGHANCQYNLGYVLLYEFTGEESYTNAIRWLRKAARQGHEEAQFELQEQGENW